ncbi:MBL fold metallo-hydrolase [Streptomyces sp. NPDC050161]|uniref:MBL fold metallo-hydrolase n=1 Tax=Streptomyces sp. NPDC050161 TaxID=3365604 RepID=UPI00378B775C
MTLPAQRAQLRVGTTSITYLPDGHSVMSAAVAFPESDWSAHRGQLDDSGQITLSFGAFLLQSGERRILVDLGMGAVDVQLPGVGRMTGGSLLASLADEGLSAEDIDTVVYTHLHIDHVGWTTDVPMNPLEPAERTPSGLTFPNARYCVSEAEWTHWTQTGGGPGAPDPHVVLAPLSDAIEFLDDGETIAPGITVHITPGHTPGNLVVAVTDPDGSGSERVLIVGDILHSVVQVAEAEWSFFADADPQQALAVRKEVLTAPGTVIAAGHFTDHVFGRVEHSGSGTTWTPVFDEQHDPAVGTGD